MDYPDFVKEPHSKIQKFTFLKRLIKRVPVSHFGENKFAWEVCFLDGDMSYHLATSPAVALWAALNVSLLPHDKKYQKELSKRFLELEQSKEEYERKEQKNKKEKKPK